MKKYFYYLTLTILFLLQTVIIMGDKPKEPKPPRPRPPIGFQSQEQMEYNHILS